MKIRKPRTATYRKVNSLLEEFGNICEWWDGGYPECFFPWSEKCEGNPFVCKKLYMHHIASAKKPNVRAVTDFEQRENNS